MALGKNLQIDKLLPDTMLGKSSSLTSTKLNVSEATRIDQNYDTPVVATMEAPETEQDQNSSQKISISIQPSKRKKVRKTKVFVEGELTLEHVEKLKTDIQPIFKDFDYVDFYLREVEKMDLSCIQLLYYFKKTQGNVGKEVTIDSELTNDMKSMIVGSGFGDLIIKPTRRR